jgi:DNA-binding NarL/FixJ family response regulator
MITIGLADDHVVVRQGLRLLLETDPEFTVVGEAANGTDALALAKRLKPQVLVLDLMMPSPDGLEVTRRMAHQKLATRVIILTMYGDDAFVMDALKGGAAGFVVKESCATELFQAVREVAAGRRYLSPALADVVKKWTSNTFTVAHIRKASRSPRQPSRSI